MTAAASTDTHVESVRPLFRPAAMVGLAIICLVNYANGCHDAKPHFSTQKRRSDRLTIVPPADCMSRNVGKLLLRLGIEPRARANLMPGPRQIVATVATGLFAERLEETFTSFARNSFLELHAFIIGERLPERRLPGINYHLFKADASFMDEMRDAYYRRLIFLDELGAEFVLLVDNSDVLCMQPLAELPQLLRGAAFAAIPEHAASRYIAGQGWTSCYFNAGVTFWNVPASKAMREEIVARGRTRFRSVEDQLTLNEVIQTRYFDNVVILPSQYNFRAHYKFRQRGWPTVDSLDGVIIYHNSTCASEAKKLIPVKPRAELPSLVADKAPLTDWQKFWRKVRLRGQPHIAR